MVTLKMVQNMILHMNIIMVGFGNSFLLCFCCSLCIVTRGMLQFLTVLVFIAFFTPPGHGDQARLGNIFSL